MQGHLFKYKDKDGNWIEIPVLVESMYNAYVTYCTKNNIEPVTEEVYYSSVGDLQNLVNKLDGSAEQVSKLIAALGAGVLPQNLGGLGVSIGTDEYPDLQTALVGLASVVTLKQLDDTIGTLRDTIGASLVDMSNSIDSKEDILSFTKGTAAPTATTPGKYYFQYS